MYYSLDELTFVLMNYGNNMSKDTTNQGCQQITCRGVRIPENAGLYAKVRSNGSSVNAYVDMKAQIHQYPLGV